MNLNSYLYLHSAHPLSNSCVSLFSLASLSPCVRSSDEKLDVNKALKLSVEIFITDVITMGIDRDRDSEMISFE